MDVDSLIRKQQGKFRFWRWNLFSQTVGRDRIAGGCGHHFSDVFRHSQHGTFSVYMIMYYTYPDRALFVRKCFSK